VSSVDSFGSIARTFNNVAYGPKIVNDISLGDPPLLLAITPLRDVVVLRYHGRDKPALSTAQKGIMPSPSNNKDSFARLIPVMSTPLIKA
jgi:hypothetical protein